MNSKFFYDDFLTFYCWILMSLKFLITKAPNVSPKMFVIPISPIRSRWKLPIDWISELNARTLLLSSSEGSELDIKWTLRSPQKYSQEYSVVERGKCFFCSFCHWILCVASKSRLEKVVNFKSRGYPKRIAQRAFTDRANWRSFDPSANLTVVTLFNIKWKICKNADFEKKTIFLMIFLASEFSFSPQIMTEFDVWCYWY